MITMTFSLSYDLRVPDMTYNLSRMDIINTSSFKASDTERLVVQFNLSSKVETVKEKLSQFSLGFSILNTDRVFLFRAPYIFNKTENLRSYSFNCKYGISAVSPNLRLFNTKYKIQIATVNRLFEFSLKYQSDAANLSTRTFRLRNKLEKSTVQHKTFDLPFILSTGDSSLATLTIGAVTNTIATATYRINGISANIGDVASLLASEILTPKLVYVVVNNGSHSLFRTGRFEIRESTKTQVLEDNGISLSLDVDEIKIEFTVDPVTPVSVKIYRGIP